MYSLCILSQYLRPKYAIETGTYVGSSSHVFQGLGVERTYSAEIVEEYANVARNRHQQLIKRGALEIILGSSVDHMPAILSGISNEQSVIAYLDAHRHNHSPTTEELNHYKTAKSWEVGNSKYTYWPHVFQIELQMANCLEGLGQLEAAIEVRRRINSLSKSLGTEPEMP